MTHIRGWTARRRYALVAATTVLMILGALVAAQPGRATSNAGGSGAVAGAKSSVAKVGQASAGRLVRAQTSTTPFAPTAAQQRAREHAMKFLASLPAAPTGRHTTAADVAPLTGPQTTMTTPQSPTSFKIFKNTTIPSKCSGCGQATVNEPDTANSGKFIVQTSNWNIAYTKNGGASTPTWLYQNPYTLSSQFCCDQTIFYMPSRNRYVYEGLTLGSGTQVGFTLATAPGNNPTSWCTYHFNGASFGLTAGDVLDYPKIAYSNNDIYVTWNAYDPTGSKWLSTGLARMPIDNLARCKGFGYGFLNRTDNFTFGLTYGHSSLDTFYWVSNWYTGGGSGSNERIYYWPENSGTYHWVDRSVAAYNFAGGSCASQDGVVTNWCSRLDPRWETAWISRAEYNAQANSAFSGDSILGVALTVGPAGNDPFPYVIYEYFKLNSLTYVQEGATYNNGYAFAYAGCAPDVHGYVGCVMSWGGGTGSTHYYPGGFLLLQDNVSPNQPWTYKFNLYGSGNASAWGDYMVTQPFQPEVGPFIATEWKINAKGHVVPHVVIWGRVRDGSGYSRWKTK